jgi:hypothetical protein
VTVVEDPTRLGGVIASLGKTARPQATPQQVPLVQELRAYIRDAVGAAGARA